MALQIAGDCTNCAACEPVCPNQAIFEGAEIFEINPDLCTECVGFHVEPQCASVCPVDVCIDDPARKETEDELIGKAKSIHPNDSFPEVFQSRYRT